MRGSVSSTEPTDSTYNTNFVLIICFSIVSFVTSYYGVLTYLDANSGQGFSNAKIIESVISIKGIVAFILIFIIQVLLVVSLMSLLTARNLVNRFIWLLVYFLPMFFSVFMSFGAYYDWLRADSFATEHFEKQLLISEIASQKVKQAMDGIQQTSQEISNYSKKTAEKENKEGKTCGDKSPPGEGPRRDLRIQEAALFEDIGKQVTMLQQSIHEDIETLERIKRDYSPTQDVIENTQRSMNEIIAKLNAYPQKPLLIRVRRDLERHSGEARQSLWVEERQRTISCPDDRITSSSQTLLQALDQFPNLSPITLFNSDKKTSVMERAFQVIISVPRFFFTKAQAENEMEKEGLERITMKDYSPLLAGLAIDLLIFAVGLINAKRLLHAKFLNGNYFGEYFSVRDFIRLQSVYEMNNLRDNLDYYLYKDRDKHVMIIPAEAYSELPGSENLIKLFKILEYNRRINPVKYRRIPLSKIPIEKQKSFADKFRLSFSSKPFFDYYYLNKNEWHELDNSLLSYERWLAKNNRT